MPFNFKAMPTTDNESYIKHIIATLIELICFQPCTVTNFIYLRLTRNNEIHNYLSFGCLFILYIVTDNKTAK